MTTARKTASRQPKVRILIGAATALGPGKVDLLEAIARTGSIAAAAREKNMSYRRAWLLVDTMNRCFRDDLVVRTTGGRGGGGAKVTPMGLDVLARYRDMEDKAAASVREEVAAFADLLAEEE
ncbi:MAG: LysR family transcriptional regulator [Rhodobacterales bacterium]|nr:LysR family transcriptional regulator [Rhodobacterales bacterium]